MLKESKVPQEGQEKVKWKAFQHDGKTYDLTHLDPRTFQFERPADGNRPAEVYKVDTVFTSHCFTRQPKTAESYGKNLLYSDGYESRLFDFRRYELSKQLPDIVRTMPARKPYHNNNRRNFFTVEIMAENGNLVEYDIFFKVRKTARGRLEMIVETAFVRDPEYDSVRRPGSRSVSGSSCTTP